MSEAQSRACRVLVVEDDYMIAMDVKEALEGAGVVVLGPVPSVADAMAILDADPDVDAAVLDINLGQESVFPVCDVLRSRDVRFVFATGYGVADIPVAYRDVARLEKPVSLRQVIDALAFPKTPGAASTRTGKGR